MRDPEKVTFKVAKLDVVEKLSYLVRALIRYYYDEELYNSHWGGDWTPESLLQVDNPIIFHELTVRFRRDSEVNSVFFDALFDNPYPEYDLGVSVYAGFYEEQRMMNFALKGGHSGQFRQLAKRIVTDNHFLIEPDLLVLFDSIGERISGTIEEGATFYRARIGVEKTVWSMDLDSRPRQRSVPYTNTNLGAPPPLLTRAGRINRSGVSYLYLATDEETAAMELRPHPGHEISIGQFRPIRPLRIAKFDVEIDKFVDSDAQLDLFEFLVAANLAMSQPVTPDSTKGYTLTQLLAEVVRQKGYDGVEFSSSLGTGKNVCAFDANVFEYVDGSSNVQLVSSLRYSFTPVEVVLEPSSSDLELD